MEHVVIEKIQPHNKIKIYLNQAYTKCAYVLLLSILNSHPCLKNGASFSQNEKGIYISIFANSIQSFEVTLLSKKEKDLNGCVEKASYCLMSLSNQQRYLESKNFSFVHINSSDILVLYVHDFPIYVCVNTLKMCEINNNMVDIYFPFSQGLLSPELRENKSLPCKVHFKCFYYILSAFILIEFFQIYSSEQKHQLYAKLVGTKLYMFFFHSMNKCIERRILFYL
jgi:hypothetical protein